jgi:thiamine-monophosphate kinase
MLERWGPRARRIGDDAAVITSVIDGAIIASTDTSIENVHFRKEWLSPAEIGYRATASALSDLAAMGAKPLGVLVAMGIPAQWRSHLDEICDGIGEATSLVDAPIIGGDLSRASELSLSITVLGSSRSVLFRTGTRPGDYVYLTGRLGGPKAALDALEQGKEPTPSARNRFAHPIPRIAEALWLAEKGATAAVDVSDGLASDLAHLASASRVSLAIDLDAVPVLGEMSPVDAAVSGEEYEVVVTAPGALDTRAFHNRFNLDLTVIGRAEQSGCGVRFTSKGEEITVGGGYLHFR